MIGLSSKDRALMRDSFTHYLEVAPEGPEREHVSAMLKAGPGGP